MQSNNKEAKVKIVMYHHILNENSRYKFKGLTTEQFIKQIEYLNKEYTIIKMEDIFQWYSSPENALPEKAALLTFDDGFKEHFDTVFPILDEEHLQGTFFVPTSVLQDPYVLDVHKIHLLLLSADTKRLKQDIFNLIKQHKKRYSLQSNGEYVKRFEKGMVKNISPYDTKDVIFVKRILQTELPPGFREKVVDILFHKHIKDNEKIISSELYANTNQLRFMNRKGMYIGPHGHNHLWMGQISREEQKKEIDLSLEVMKEIGYVTTQWAMSYPNGDSNKQLMNYLTKKGCKIGMVDNSLGIADLAKNNPFILPRIDTRGIMEEMGKLIPKTIL